MRAYRILSVFSVGFLSVLNLCVVPAMAEVVVAGPGLSTAEVENLSVDFNQAFESIDNPYLSDSLKLNYQISLLEKLAERQAELTKINDSFSAMGIPFNEPAPTRGICAQLPANAPCLKYYPELYDNVVKERKAYYDEIRAKMAASNPDSVPVDTTDPKALERQRKAQEERARLEAEARARAEKAARAVRYQWSEVSCLAGYCQGVIVSSKIPGFRATVRKGTRLADGTLVEDITTRGIKILIGGDHVDLRPLGSEGSTGAATAAASATSTGGMTATPLSDTSNTAAPANADAGTLQDAAAAGPAVLSITNTPPEAAPVAAVDMGVSGGGGPSSGVSMVEPTIGPSGLF